MTGLEPLMERNFLEYASYVIVDRAIPELRDGLKPVQRRILSTLHKMDDGKFHKVANVIGETMKLHPHGDASIGDALVVLANKEFFIEKQGNFGNIVTGHSAAAARYIECRLTELARETLFSKALTIYQPSYDGRNKEPVFLPAKLPVILMLGTEGIAVGMSTRILPHNLSELLEAQVKLLQHESVHLFPDFPTGGIIDVSEYADGKGKVRVRARIDVADEKKIVIHEIPFSTTTENLIASIEAAAQKGKVKISSINDFTTDRVEIEIGLPRGVYASEVVPQLYAYTECEVSITSNILVINERHPVELGVSELLRTLTDQLRDQIGLELEHELGELKEKRHWLNLERLFIEQRVYKRIEDATTDEDVRRECYLGLRPFFDKLEREVSDEDIKRLLDIPIRRISRFDIEKNKRDLEDNDIAVAKVEVKLARLTHTTVQYLKGLLKKYGGNYPRRTEITSFESVDVRAVARQNIKVGYDPETGYFGCEVKGSQYQLTVSEYDRILIITRDGAFRITGPSDKMLIEGEVVYLDLFDQNNGQTFTVVYRDKQKNAFAKRVQIKRFIRDREYELIKDKDGRLEYLIPGESKGQVRLDFVPAKRQKVSNIVFDMNTLELTGVSARGTRMAPKPVSKLRWLKDDGATPATPSTAPQPATDPLIPKAKPSKPPAPPQETEPESSKDSGDANEDKGKDREPDDGGQFSLF
ncbi:MAG: DNA topoisomerase IV subunit A [Myxococcota bacterium]|jgi:topoisomerase-4 subunit A|nr:DNA topoisomerase IV subunit A [Myxococcota bacterium]